MVNPYRKIMHSPEREVLDARLTLINNIRKSVRTMEPTSLERLARLVLVEREPEGRQGEFDLPAA
jgi:hypothetical protein